MSEHTNAEEGKPKKQTKKREVAISNYLLGIEGNRRVEPQILGDSGVKIVQALQLFVVRRLAPVLAHHFLQLRAELLNHNWSLDELKEQPAQRVGCRVASCENEVRDDIPQCLVGVRIAVVVLEIHEATEKIGFPFQFRDLKLSPLINDMLTEIIDDLDVSLQCGLGI